MAYENLSEAELDALIAEEIKEYSEFQNRKSEPFGDEYLDEQENAQQLPSGFKRTIRQVGENIIGNIAQAGENFRENISEFEIGFGPLHGRFAFSEKQLKICDKEVVGQMYASNMLRVGPDVEPINMVRQRIQELYENMQSLVKKEGDKSPVSIFIKTFFDYSTVNSFRSGWYLREKNADSNFVDENGKRIEYSIETDSECVRRFWLEVREVKRDIQNFYFILKYIIGDSLEEIKNKMRYQFELLHVKYKKDNPHKPPYHDGINASKWFNKLVQVYEQNLAANKGMGR